MKVEYLDEIFYIYLVFQKSSLRIYLKQKLICDKFEWQGVYLVGYTKNTVSG